MESVGLLIVIYNSRFRPYIFAIYKGRADCMDFIRLKFTLLDLLLRIHFLSITIIILQFLVTRQTFLIEIHPYVKLVFDGHGYRLPVNTYPLYICLHSSCAAFGLRNLVYFVCKSLIIILLSA